MNKQTFSLFRVYSSYFLNVIINNRGVKGLEKKTVEGVEGTQYFQNSTIIFRASIISASSS